MHNVLIMEDCGVCSFVLICPGLTGHGSFVISQVLLLKQKIKMNYMCLSYLV